ncbi:MAG TPA: S41 family peptidase [Longimicrobiales bacterium]|nr:S41 family peptidase [Longimicrobiales bacterium]
MSRLRKRLTAPLALGLIFLGGFVSGGAVADGGRLLRQVASLLDRYYVERVDVNQLYVQAARDMLDRLGDPYAQLYGPEDAETYRLLHEGSYGGTGMVVVEGVGPVAVTRLLPGGPAERAGIRVGDRLQSVNGESIAGWPTDRIVSALRGEAGSRVRVGLSRPGVDGMFEVELTRATLRVPAVPYATVLEGNVGYVPIRAFGEGTADEVRDAVRQVVDDGARTLILDLRGNGGGILEEAVEVAGHFLPRGTPVVDQRERGDRVVYRTRRNPIAPRIPLVVLIDGGSASAAEILAGALQDHDRALLVGAPTYGKGVIQRAFQLQDGWIAKFTTGRWYTPLGRSIHLERDPETREVLPGAVSTDSAEWPRVRTAGGRVLAGPGGIRPDVAVEPDTLDGAERALADLIETSPQAFHTAVLDLALEVRETVRTPDFDVPAEWRARLYELLAAAGMEADREAYRAAAPAIDRLIAARVAELVFGEGAALRRGLADDPALRRAVELLGRVTAQAQLFETAAATPQ